jgi:hypothetical protein
VPGKWRYRKASVSPESSVTQQAEKDICDWSGERLLEIGLDILDVLESHGHAHLIFYDAG